MDELDQLILNDPIKRADEASRIINSPVWIDVWQQMEAAIVQGWKEAPMRDQDGMSELKRMHKTLTSLKANFESALVDGKVEKINQERSLKGRVADWFSRDAA